MLQKKFIGSSLTDWVISTIFAPPNDIFLQYGVNKREVKVVMIRYSYLLPRIDQCNASLGSARISYSILYEYFVLLLLDFFPLTKKAEQPDIDTPDLCEFSTARTADSECLFSAATVWLPKTSLLYDADGILKLMSAIDGQPQGYVHATYDLAYSVSVTIRSWRETPRNYGYKTQRDKRFTVPSWQMAYTLQFLKANRAWELYV